MEGCGQSMRFSEQEAHLNEAHITAAAATTTTAAAAAVQTATAAAVVRKKNKGVTVSFPQPEPTPDHAQHLLLAFLAVSLALNLILFDLC